MRFINELEVTTNHEAKLKATVTFSDIMNKFSGIRTTNIGKHSRRYFKSFFISPFKNFSLASTLSCASYELFLAAAFTKHDNLTSISSRCSFINSPNGTVECCSPFQGSSIWIHSHPVTILLDPKEYSSAASWAFYQGSHLMKAKSLLNVLLQVPPEEEHANHRKQDFRISIFLQ